MHGDAKLAEKLVQRLGPRHPVAAVATVTPSGTTVATVGAPLDADFEIGSISKGVTGLLYADALERGEVTPSTTLGDLLDLAGSPAAGVTLSSLSTHRSGLPRLPAPSVRKTLALWLHGANPYGETVDELLAQTRAVRLGPPRPHYSNLGFQLLGHALAAAAGTTFTALLDTRIATPLGLTTFYAPATASDLHPGALTGRTKRGRRRAPWTGEALAPAGGIRTTITDLAHLTETLLTGEAPGTDALTPVADFTGKVVRIGAAWITLDRLGRTITWHNGGTGGFSTWLGLDRAAGTAVAVLSATAVSVDHHGFTLLAELTAAEGS
ncbi:serine hydrolase domain-containing protein [Saccharothrix variisporea]|uniref:Beta-lactamase n=1 Tax=Saccharothrix variisporea TaxID=543527 RepID=A0A495WZ51_9PSEU|nr:serine hydrolase domain-containing protein [Saccharothrix variisporea]RKT66962.1 CubicO group peptidase (beta-lactamase class C family) [Saccharothrix variisporea]